jgi:DNA invertase Pin-like site-specific DNA recombinase
MGGDWRNLRFHCQSSQRTEVFTLNSAEVCRGLLWTYICLCDILYANEKDGSIPQGTAAAETPEAIRQNWRTRRRTGSPRHRCIPAFEEEGIEMKKRAVLYCRISTGEQHLETQLLDLREMAKLRGCEIVHEYTDIISGSKAKRPGLDQLMADARRHRFDVVLVVAFDRIARNVRHFLDVPDELNQLGIEFVSKRENIDTSGPLGRAMLTIVGAISELERSLIVERVRAGMRRAKLEGRRIGRAPLDIDRVAVVADRRAGMSLTKVAKKYHVSRATVCRLVNESGGLRKPSVPQLRKEERVVSPTDSSNLPTAA